MCWRVGTRKIRQDYLLFAQIYGLLYSLVASWTDQRTVSYIRVENVFLAAACFKCLIRHQVRPHVVHPVDHHLEFILTVIRTLNTRPVKLLMTCVMTITVIFGTNSSCRGSVFNKVFKTVGSLCRWTNRSMRQDCMSHWRRFGGLTACWTVSSYSWSYALFVFVETNFLKWDIHTASHTRTCDGLKSLFNFVGNIWTGLHSRHH